MKIPSLTLLLICILMFINGMLFQKYYEHVGDMYEVVTTDIGPIIVNDGKVFKLVKLIKQESQK